MVYRKTKHVEAKLADNRKHILKSARELVSEGGWAEAQISHVAASAGVGVGSVYRYFPSKADLFVEVLAEVSQREVDVLATIANAEESPSTRLHIAVATFVKRAMRNRRLAYAMIAEPCQREIDEARLSYRESISATIMQIVLDGQKEGDFRSDINPSIAATVIVGGFMEALIGPLSPLNADFSTSDESSIDAVHKLAEQIADLCCTSLLDTGALGSVTQINQPKS